MKRLIPALMLFAAAVSAQQSDESLLNKLFAPGPLIEGHKELEEKDCLKCHDAGKGLPDAKCLECHKEISPFMERKKGFHGLTGKRCFECHKDHKGRALDTVRIDEKTFDHNLTGYKLTGKHAEVKCVECHQDKRKDKPLRPHDTRYFGQTVTCVSCHKKDDIHYFRGDFAKRDCSACHTNDTWKKSVNFDHNKDTQFKLEGSHSNLKCADCHKPSGNKAGTSLKALPKHALGIYGWPKLKTAQCLSCHTDFHGKSLSGRYQNGRCDTCHNQNKWSIAKFDHKVTGYPLRGKHAEAKCLDCHKQTAKVPSYKTNNYNYSGLKQDCLSCHKDFHFFGKFSSARTRKPNACISCHNETDWKKTHDFNHTVDTRYVIDGKHSDLKCNDCHKPVQSKKDMTLRALPPKAPGIYHWEKLPKDTCTVCHANPHIKTFSPKFLAKKCTECHVTEGWKIKPSQSKKDFNHDTTRFPLTGRHTKVECSACHNINGKQVFKFSSFEQKFCVDCHRNPHKEQFHEKFFGRACTECHSTDTFSKQKEFDHNQTAFGLKGKHMELKCLACHVPSEKSAYEKKTITWHKFIFPDLAAKNCTTCHNDFHGGQLGQRCDSCHNEQTWKKVKFDHNRDTKFPLKSKHQAVKCSECHEPVRNKFVTFGPDGQKHRLIRYRPIDGACITCHRKDDQHKGNFGASCQNCHLERGWKVVKDFHKNFTLHGVHFTLECAECHQQDRQLGGMSENCILCHQKDDVHNGSLPNCSECHRQQFWEHTSFRHSRTSFPIRGSHRALDCFECHNRGVYHGTPTSCNSCHVGDVVNSNFNHGAILNVLECSECHNQFTFDLGQ
jgi:hypothetical protein